MSELKKCPFCGGEADKYDYEAEHDIYDPETLGYVDTEYYTKYGCYCTLCGCMIAEKKSEQEAIEAWNTRADGWISVKDEPPKEAGSYLVNLHQEDEETGECSDCVLFAWYQPTNLLFCEKDIGWTLLNEFYDLTSSLRQYITHWKPLPEPPKGD